MKRHLHILLAVAVAAMFALAACRGEESAPAKAPAPAATAGQAAASQPKLDEGVTATEIKIGSTQPLSGPASVYASIPRGSEAYFNYINDQGGVNGRKIVYKYVDDTYAAPKTVELTRQLVEEEKVWAMFNPLGTANGLAVRDYLNQKGVPQIFVATGASTWGADHEKYKWTIGWQPDYQSEAIAYAQYLLKNQPNGKIGILYQNDDYGKDYIAGLERGLGDKKAMIVARQPHELTATDVTPQVSNLKEAGADIFAVFTTPTFAVRALKAKQGLGWNPTVIYNSVSNSVSTMKAAGEDASEGAISAVYLKDPTDPKWADDASVKLYKQVLAKYAPQADPNDTYYFYGMAVADTFVQVVNKMGNDLTRANLLRTVEDLKDLENPFLLPGIKINTSSKDKAFFPIQQMNLEKYQGGKWVLFGDLIDASKTK
jgi:branched-chain amino acid transport system substrate-binding protein